MSGLSRRAERKQPFKEEEGEEEQLVPPRRAPSGPLSPHHVRELRGKNTAEELQEALKEISGFDHQTNMGDAALLDLYLCALRWSDETKFSAKQTSFTVNVLHMLLDNIRGKRMSLVDNLMEFVAALHAACQSSTSDADASEPLLDDREAMELTAFIRNSLFQKHGLFVVVWGQQRDQLLTSTERTVEVFPGGPGGVAPLEDADAGSHHSTDGVEAQ